MLYEAAERVEVGPPRRMAQDARLAIRRAITAQQIEAIKDVGGEWVLIDRAALAAAEIDFASSRMRAEGGSDEPPEVKVVPLRLIFQQWEEPATPLAQQAGRSPTTPPPVLDTKEWVEKFGVFPGGGEYIDWEKSYAKERAYYGATGPASPRPTSEEEARQAANQLRETMERDFGLIPQEFTDQPPAIKGPEFGPVIGLLADDVDCIVAPRSTDTVTSGPAPTIPPIESASPPGRSALYNWPEVERQVRRRCLQYGIPASKSELAAEIAEYFRERGLTAGSSTILREVAKMWPWIEDLARPAEVRPFDAER